MGIISFALVARRAARDLSRVDMALPASSVSCPRNKKKDKSNCNNLQIHISPYKLKKNLYIKIYLILYFKASTSPENLLLLINIFIKVA